MSLQNPRNCITEFHYTRTKVTKFLENSVPFLKNSVQFSKNSVQFSKNSVQFLKKLSSKNAKTQFFRNVRSVNSASSVQKTSLWCHIALFHCRLYEIQKQIGLSSEDQGARGNKRMNNTLSWKNERSASRDWSKHMSSGTIVFHRWWSWFFMYFFPALTFRVRPWK